MELRRVSARENPIAFASPTVERLHEDCLVIASTEAMNDAPFHPRRAIVKDRSAGEAGVPIAVREFCDPVAGLLAEQ